MTDRERKNHYLFSLRCTLAPRMFFPVPLNRERLEEKIKIIYMNNSEEWADAFMVEEVIPLLKRHGIIAELKEAKPNETYSIHLPANERNQ